MAGGRSDVTDGWLTALVLSAVWFYLAEDLVTLSMGLDGVVYAGIASFMAAGEGAFWAPVSFQADIDFFHDHPPLGVWLQSLWFRVAGHEFWVENVFCAAMIAAVAGLMGKQWRAIDERECGLWWPLLLLCAMPVTLYTFKNNALESMVTVTALAGVYAAWRGRQQVGYNALVGVACIVGSLIKGPVALFPLAAPACFALIMERDPRKAVPGSVLAVGVCTAGLIALLLYEPAAVYLQRYFDGQIVASLTGERYADRDRMFLLGTLLQNLLVAGALLSVAWLVFRRFAAGRTALSFFILALLACLPLLISPRQFRHYLLPSMPLFAIAFALWVPALRLRLRGGYVRAAAMLLLAAGCARAALHFGAPGDDAVELAEARSIARAIGDEGMVAFCGIDLQVRTYLSRHHGIRSVQALRPPEQGYLVCTADALGGDYVELIALTEGRSLWTGR